MVEGEGEEGGVAKRVAAAAVVAHGVGAGEEDGVEGGDGLYGVVEVDGPGEAEVGEQAEWDAGGGDGGLELGVLDGL